MSTLKTREQLNGELEAWRTGATNHLPVDDMRRVAKSRFPSWARNRVIDEDLIQDALLKLCEQKAEGMLDGAKPVMNYWLTNVWSLCHRTYRKWNAKLQIVPSSPCIEVVDPECDHSAAYCEAVDGWDFRMHVAKLATEVLEGAQLRRFLAVDVEGRHYSELADEEGVSRQAIHLTLMKARKRVAERLEEDQSQPTA